MKNRKLNTLIINFLATYSYSLAHLFKYFTYLATKILLILTFSLYLKPSLRKFVEWIESKRDQNQLSNRYFWLFKNYHLQLDHFWQMVNLIRSLICQQISTCEIYCILITPKCFQLLLIWVKDFQVWKKVLSLL